MSSSEAIASTSYAASSYYLPYEHVPTNEEIDNISNIEVDLTEGISSNFTNDSILDALTYSDIDRQVFFTMEKNIHLHERKSKLHIQRKDLASLDPEQWVTDTAIEAYMTSFAETTTLYILPSIRNPYTVIPLYLLRNPIKSLH